MITNAAAEQEPKAPSLWDLSSELFNKLPVNRVLWQGHVDGREAEIKAESKHAWWIRLGSRCRSHSVMHLVKLDNSHNPKNANEVEPYFDTPNRKRFFQSDVGVRTKNDFVKFLINRIQEMAKGDYAESASERPATQTLREIGDKLYGDQRGFRKRTVWRGKVGSDNVTLEAESGHEFCVVATPVDGSKPTAYAHCVITNIGDQFLRFGNVKFAQADVGAMNASDLARFIVTKGILEIKKLRASATATAAVESPLREDPLEIKLRALISMLRKNVGKEFNTDCKYVKLRVVDDRVQKAVLLQPVVSLAVEPLQKFGVALYYSNDGDSDIVDSNVMMGYLRWDSITRFWPSNSRDQIMKALASKTVAGFFNIASGRDHKFWLRQFARDLADIPGEQRTRVRRVFGVHEAIALSEITTGSLSNAAPGHVLQSCVEEVRGEHKSWFRRVVKSSFIDSVVDAIRGRATAAAEPETDTRPSAAFLKVVKVLAAMTGKTYTVNGIEVTETSNKNFSAKEFKNKYPHFYRKLKFTLDREMELNISAQSVARSADIDVRGFGAHFMATDEKFSVDFSLIQNPQQLLQLIFNRLRLREGGQREIAKVNESDARDFARAVLREVLKDASDYEHPDYDEDNGEPRLDESYHAHDFDSDSFKRVQDIARRFLTQAIPKLQSVAHRYPSAARHLLDYATIGYYAYHSSSGSGVSFDDMNYGGTNSINESVRESLAAYLDRLADNTMPSEFNVDINKGVLSLGDNVRVRAASEMRQEHRVDNEKVFKGFLKIRKPLHGKYKDVDFILFPDGTDLIIQIAGVQTRVKLHYNSMTMYLEGTRRSVGARFIYATSATEWVKKLVATALSAWNLRPNAHSQLPDAQSLNSFVVAFTDSFLEYTLNNVSDPSATPDRHGDTPYLAENFGVDQFTKKTVNFVNAAAKQILKQAWGVVLRESGYVEARAHSEDKALDWLANLGFAAGGHRAATISGSGMNLSDHSSDFDNEDELEAHMSGLPSLPYLDVDVDVANRKLDLAQMHHAHAAAEAEPEPSLYREVTKHLRKSSRIQIAKIDVDGFKGTVEISASGKDYASVIVVSKPWIAVVSVFQGVVNGAETSDIATGKEIPGARRLADHSTVKFQSRPTSLKDIVSACAREIKRRQETAEAAAEKPAEATVLSILLHKLGTKTRDVTVLRGKDARTKYVVTCIRPETDNFGSASLFVDLVIGGSKVLCAHMTTWADYDNGKLRLFIRPYDKEERLEARFSEETLTAAAIPRTFDRIVKVCIALLHKYKAKMDAVTAAAEPYVNTLTSDLKKLGRRRINVRGAEVHKVQNVVFVNFGDTSASAEIHDKKTFLDSRRKRDDGGWDTKFKTVDDTSKIESLGHLVKMLMDLLPQRAEAAAEAPLPKRGKLVDIVAKLKKGAKGKITIHGKSVAVVIDYVSFSEAGNRCSFSFKLGTLPVDTSVYVNSSFRETVVSLNSTRQLNKSAIDIDVNETTLTEVLLKSVTALGLDLLATPLQSIPALMLSGMVHGYMSNAIDIIEDDTHPEYDSDTGDGPSISVDGSLDQVSSAGREKVTAFVRSFLHRVLQTPGMLAALKQEEANVLGGYLFLSAENYSAAFKENMNADKHLRSILDTAANVGSAPRPFVVRGQRGNVREIGFE